MYDVDTYHYYNVGYYIIDNILYFEQFLNHDSIRNIKKCFVSSPTTMYGNSDGQYGVIMPEIHRKTDVLINKYNISLASRLLLDAFREHIGLILISLDETREIKVPYSYTYLIDVEYIYKKVDKMTLNIMDKFDDKQDIKLEDIIKAILWCKKQDFGRLINIQVE